MMRLESNENLPNISPNTNNKIDDNALPHAIFQHIDREIHFHFERTLDELIKFQAKQG